jgi:hypothetical protein
MSLWKLNIVDTRRQIIQVHAQVSLVPTTFIYIAYFGHVHQVVNRTLKKDARRVLRSTGSRSP